MMKKTLVIGASENTDRYSNRAIHRLLDKNIEVVALGLREGVVATIPITTKMEYFKNIHTITLYLNAKNQEAYYEYIISLNPKRVIFNPGTENPHLEKMLLDNNISFEQACTLVLLGIGSY